MNEIFEIHALAVSEEGGHCFPIQGARFIHGTGRMIITGNIAPLSKECIDIAMSALRLKNAQLSNLDIHLHTPDPDSFKTGYSWGLCIYTLLSWLLGVHAYQPGLAATGEIDLFGNVIAAPMVNEKILAFKDSACDTLFLPKANLHELDTDINFKHCIVSNVEDLTYYFTGGSR